MVDLNFVVGVASIISVAIALFSVAYTVYSFKKGIQAQIFMSFTERYERIMDDLGPIRVGMESMKPSDVQEPQKLMVVVLKYLNLCSEEYYMHQRNLVSRDVWDIWNKEIRQAMRVPVFNALWPTLRPSYESYTSFLKYMDNVVEEGVVAASGESSLPQRSRR